MALLVWDAGKTPTLFLNEEVQGLVEHVQVVATRPVTAGDPVTPDDIGGLGKLQLHRDLWKKTCLFLIQGKDSKYFLRTSRLRLLPSADEFRKLDAQLATEGVLLTAGTSTMPVQLDLTRNGYVGTPHQKRTLFRELRDNLVVGGRKTAPDRVRRHLRLPAFVAHADDDVMPLLVEARQAYIDGLYFSSIAASTTTADRICNRQLYRYVLDKGRIKKLLALTFGQKLQDLHSLNLIGPTQERLLRSLNAIRTRYLHPKKTVTNRAVQRDALRAISLLHKFLDETESVLKDYMIEEGRLVPRPLL